MHRFSIQRLVAVLGFLSWTAAASAIGTPPSWKPRETVVAAGTDFISMIGADRSLAYDHHGNPGVAFEVGNELRFADRVPGVGWVHSVVDTLGSVAGYPSLAYDRYERPVISYYVQGIEDLKYARYTGSDWQIETIDSTGSVGFYTSLAFDLLGRPAIAYYDRTNSSLKYVEDTDGDFSLVDETLVTVANQFDEGNSASLVFDGFNRPMIAHWDETNFDLRFSIREPGLGWLTTTVDGAGGTGFTPSIAIDPDNGFPAIAYRDDTNGDLRYAAWDGNVWNLTTADATNNVGLYPSLAFDPADGNPAIAYGDFTNANLRLAWHDGSTWQTQTVDALNAFGWTPSLAFNEYGNGYPSIVYFRGAGTGPLYFIEDPPGVTVPEPASVMLLALGLLGWLTPRDRASSLLGTWT